LQHSVNTSKVHCRLQPMFEQYNTQSSQTYAHHNIIGARQTCSTMHGLAAITNYIPISVICATEWKLHRTMSLDKTIICDMWSCVRN